MTQRHVGQVPLVAKQFAVTTIPRPEPVPEFAASNSGSTRTAPVKYSSGPFPERREPHRLMSVTGSVPVSFCEHLPLPQ